MTSTIASYAAGDLSHYALGEESRKITGKKRRTVYSSAARPLFVAEAEFRARKVFTRSKKGMLALYGTDMHVVDVLGLEAADVSSGSADAASHVLRWVHYIDLLDISFTGPATLRIEHGDTSDKPKVMGVGETLAAAAAEGSDTSASAQGACCVSVGGAPMAASAAAAPASNASVRVTYDSFTLTFRDAGVAQQAAAALLFQQAQYAAVCHWLRMGLHAGFRFDLISVNALPLLFNDSQHLAHPLGSFGGSGLARNHSLLPPHVLYSCASGNFGRSSLPGCAATSGATSAAGAGAGSSAGAAAGSIAGAAAAVPYPWDYAGAQDWGCSVPLPVGWGPFLDAAAAASAGGAGHGDDTPGATPEELTCPVVLDQGPEALQVTLSTPLGAAVATITLQLAKAALRHPTCRDILALPLHPNSSSSSSTESSSSSSAAPMAAFTWSVQGNVSTAAGTAAGPDGSASSSSNNLLSAGLNADDRASSFSSAGAQSSGGLPLAYTMDAFASLSIQMVRTPSTVNTRGAGRVFYPEGSAASTHPSCGWQPVPAAAAGGSTAGGAAAGGPAAGGAGAAAGAGVSSNGSSNWQSSSNMQLQLAVCAILAAVAVQQSHGQLLVLLFQLLLLAAVAAAAVVTAQSSSSSSSGVASTAGQQVATAAVAEAPQPSRDSSSTSSENIYCCGWSIVLVGADLCSTPSRHLQLQVSLAKASRGMARLRLRLASMSTGGAPVQLLGGPSDEAEDESMPVLVSDPEPIWLNTDTKQRFINAKPTLEASQEQARRTDKWRRQMDVDTVLMRPCPKFPLMCRLLPTYLLSDNTPEGHAVVLMKVGGVKDLCDAIFQMPEGSPDGLTLLEAEHTLALLNEYLVQVAAPRALPAGFQVQIYDLAGFKLSYVMGDMFNLFKLLVRFGLYYPERLRQALVINAPAWFSTPWKAMSAFMDENTSAKVVVVGNPKSALSTIAHHLGGIDNVPVAWGGRCEVPFEQYPSNIRMMDFGRRLNAGEKPFPGLSRC